MTETPDILICECAWGGTLPKDRLAALTAALRERGIPFAVIPDLCALAAEKSGDLDRWASRPGVGIVACRPRSIRCLFDAAGRTLNAEARLIDLRDTRVEDALLQLGTGDATSSAARDVKPAGTDASRAAPDWLPWFPTLDRERCTSCGQCVEFCLFGVYETRDGQVVVEHPERCKPHCPACARICPKAAIIFAKHNEAPIDGSPVGSEEEADAQARRNLHAMLGDDPIAALAERKRRARPATVVDPDRLRRALAERQAHGGRPDRGTGKVQP